MTKKSKELTLEAILENIRHKIGFEIILAGAGLTLVLIGIFGWLNLGKSSTNDIEILPATTSANISSEQILVDVAGAVNSPGVYKLPADSRVGEAIERAGGLAADANSDWISKSLNLAAKLSDGAKIYIPYRGEGITQSVAGTNIRAVSKINVNTASSSELKALPAVGPVTASKIIDGRPYSSIEELLTKKVVGKSAYEKIKDLVSTF